MYDIKTSPMVILSSGLVMHPDEIYGDNIVAYMADFLSVKPEDIRITNIIREDSGKTRKKRQDLENFVAEVNLESG